MAASIPIRSGETVLELGCGGGAALACLAARVPGIVCYGVDIQPGYAALAQRNLDESGARGLVYCADINALPAAVKSLRFHHVIANPPYFESPHTKPPIAADRAFARSGVVPLAEWANVASRRLRPGGMATFIQRAERLPELMAAFRETLGALELWPIQPRAGRSAGLFFLRGRKTRRAAFVLHPPLILHRGDRHESDGDSYTEGVSKALRQPEPLRFPGERRDESWQC
ncbi:methyltransferase domain-containing protein [Marivita sp. GX14005]|uniref:tRNA1(Val) (adenine(37)-N6)-methyltransferase n=1 Tax=Marivita sp. GX14005 TaxID=2942276 RepID=UPI0032D574BF